MTRFLGLGPGIGIVSLKRRLEMLVLYRHWTWALPKDVGERARRPQHLDPQE